MPKSLQRPNGAPGRAAVRDRRARRARPPRPPRDARPHALAQLHTLDRETFGKRLRSARKRFGWTLAETAERSGISITTISRAERGQLALSYEKFSALAGRCAWTWAPFSPRPAARRRTSRAPSSPAPARA